MGANPSTWNFGSTGHRWSEIADFEQIFARSASAVKPSEKSSVITNVHIAAATILNQHSQCHKDSNDLRKDCCNHCLPSVYRVTKTKFITISTSELGARQRSFGQRRLDIPGACSCNKHKSSITTDITFHYSFDSSIVHELFCFTPCVSSH